jgi:hypothetical protein
MRSLEYLSRTERRIGLLVILLLLTILAAFAYVVATDRNYLFDVTPTGEMDGASPPDHTIAAQLLPPLADTPWTEPQAIETIRPDEFAQYLTQDAPVFAAFGVRSAYRRVYCADDQPADCATVVTVDAGSPAQAFGLSHARRPADASPLDLGAGAWTQPANRRVGFWKGRYYTELTASPTGAEPLTALVDAARNLAAHQLDYGNVRWAQDLLPTEGQLPDTFRYVHRAALGLEGLDRVFLVDLDNGVTAWVLNAATPATAARLVRTLAESAIAASPTGEYNEYEAFESGPAATISYDGPLTVVPWDTRQLAMFSSDQYAFGVYGTASLDVLSTAKRLHATVLATTSPIDGPHPSYLSDRPSHRQMSFPPIDSPGWAPVGAAASFTPDTLFRKIDGRADAYLQYNVVTLHFGTYANADDPSQTVDVYWYDMGEPANAFGIYRLEAPPGAHAVPIGDAAYETGGAIFFRKASSYVQILPSSGTESDSAAALAIAHGIASRIQSGDADTEAWARHILPATDRVPGSLSFIAENPFGLDFLADVFTAEYNNETSGRLTLFVHRAPDKASARALLGQYRAFIEKYGRILPTGTEDADDLLTGEVAGLFDVVFAKGPYLAGVAGAQDPAAAQRRCRTFFDELDVP